jgi:hypothetical protein
VPPEKRCYLCGKTVSQTPEGKLERDHLPPQNLFLEPKPSNLITVPCCKSCNHAQHKDDESFRVVVTGFLNRNAQAERLWNQKTVPRTIKNKKGRVRDRIDEVRKSIRQIGLITPKGLVEAAELSFARGPIDRVLTRMTKGFLSRLYPQIDRSLLHFTITPIDQFKLNDPVFEMFRKATLFFERGVEGRMAVYRCWFVVDDTYSLRGIWVHMFFDSATFMVEHKSDRVIELPW